MALNPKQPIRLIAFDLDGTLVDGTVFFWNTLHEAFGSDPKRRKEARTMYRAGRLSYAQWFQIDLELLKEKGATRDAILKVISGLFLFEGARQTIDELRRRGYLLAIISGSLDILLDVFFPDRPFAYVLINRIFFDPDGIIAGGVPTPYDMEKKADGLAELAKRAGLSLSSCAFVGDNTNDIQVMKKAGFSVGVHLKDPRLEEVVDVVLDDSPLTPLLSLFNERVILD